MTLLMKSVVIIVILVSCQCIESKSNLSFDEFFDYTEFPSISFSPTGEHLLIHIYRPAWDFDSYENSLWLYDIQTKTKKLITRTVGGFIESQWSPSGKWIALTKAGISAKNMNLDFDRFQRSATSDKTPEKYIYLYSVLSDELISIGIGTKSALMFTWSDKDSSLYFVTSMSKFKTEEEQALYEREWRDVINYRQWIKSNGNAILRLDIDENDPRLSTKINVIKYVDFSISDLLFVGSEHKLILTSSEAITEKFDGFEMYSIDLNNTHNLSQLTNNQVSEVRLILSKDGKHILFQEYNRVVNSKGFNDTQSRLFSLDLTSGFINQLAKDFTGNIVGYTTDYDGSVLIRGQVGVEVKFYRQASQTEETIQIPGWNGTYEKITLSSKQPSLVAFVYSSLERPKEVYIANSINDLLSADAITNENDLYNQRELPQTKVYRWKSEEDKATIEGILHYPPGKFEENNLPLFILMHGGPYDASLNAFEANWYNWAPLAALNGWLVLEPNYCGSTGYGDRFVDEVRRQPLSRPGREILAAVDHLIKDGIVDPNRLAIGGYSYGGLLTNWLIAQTTRFNAALSGAGSLEHVSAWGTMDIPVLFSHLFGGLPWVVPELYQNESSIFKLDRVRTPTHIVTGADDTRVDADQSYILERALHILGVPVQLLVFPDEGHGLGGNPWHGKIKVREEINWLQKYGHKSWSEQKH